MRIFSFVCVLFLSIIFGKMMKHLIYHPCLIKLNYFLLAAMGNKMDPYYHRYGMKSLRNEYPFVVFGKSKYTLMHLIYAYTSTWCYELLIMFFAYNRHIPATLMKKQHAQTCRWTLLKH